LLKHYFCNWNHKPYDVTTGPVFMWTTMSSHCLHHTENKLATQIIGHKAICNGNLFQIQVIAVEKVYPWKLRRLTSIYVPVTKSGDTTVWPSLSLTCNMSDIELTINSVINKFEKLLCAFSFQYTYPLQHSTKSL